MGKYEVTAKCGHVGRNKYVVKSFAVVAENGREAAHIVRHMPRVKHHRKDAILNVTAIDDERYFKIKADNEKDPYFRCSCKQEQELFCLGMEIYPETKEEKKRYVRKQDDQILFHKKKIRHYRKYVIRYLPADECLEPA